MTDIESLFEQACAAVKRGNERRAKDDATQWEQEPTIGLNKRNLNDYQKWIMWETRPHVCAICGKPIEHYIDFEMDHIVPWCKKGKTTPDNLQMTHANCNRMKGTKDMKDVMEQKAGLLTDGE